MKEMYRVLKPGGLYIVVSHGGPETRTGYLQRGARWTVEYVPIRKFFTCLLDLVFHLYSFIILFVILYVLHSYLVFVVTAKPEVSGIDEKGPAKNHYIYICRKSATV